VDGSVVVGWVATGVGDGVGVSTTGAGSVLLGTVLLDVSSSPPPQAVSANAAAASTNGRETVARVTVVKASRAPGPLPVKQRRVTRQ